MDYLAKIDIYHRDIKPGNMIIVGSKIKLIDFGISTLEKEHA